VANNEIQDRVIELIANVFGIELDSLNMDSNFENLDEWDSLNHIRLMEEIEKEFGLNLTSDDMISFISVRSIVKGLEGV